MKKFLALALVLGTLCPFDSHAAVRRIYQDLKLPTQVVMEKQTLTDPAAGGTTQVVTNTAGATSAALATLSTFSAQPDVARNLVITPTGSTNDVGSCVITVSGTNYLNASMSETFTFADNASTATTGSKAFKTISSVSFPANCEDGAFNATWSIGYGVKLGLKRCMDNAGQLVFATEAGVYASTRPTVTASNTVIESNTASMNSAPDAAKDYELFFLQNFRCK